MNTFSVTIKIPRLTRTAFVFAENEAAASAYMLSKLTPKQREVAIVSHCLSLPYDTHSAAYNGYRETHPDLETKPTPELGAFSKKEAMNLFGNPDKDGWVLGSFTDLGIVFNRNRQDSRIYPGTYWFNSEKSLSLEMNSSGFYHRDADVADYYLVHLVRFLPPVEFGKD